MAWDLSDSVLEQASYLLSTDLSTQTLMLQMLRTKVKAARANEMPVVQLSILMEEQMCNACIGGKRS